MSNCAKLYIGTTSGSSASIIASWYEPARFRASVRRRKPCPSPMSSFNEALRVLRNPKPDGLHLYDPHLPNADSKRARSWEARFDRRDAQPPPEPPKVVPPNLGKLHQSIRGGSPCPAAGWWYTHAMQNSRRYFKQGEIMPVVEGSSWGWTYWIWEHSQDSSA